MPLIRSPNLNLLLEFVVRFLLLCAFCYMETMSPFVRVLHASELESDCKYPRRDSYVSTVMLWSIVLSVPCILSFVSWAILNDCNDALELLLAWSMALGLNGLITDGMKLIAGRPRPDFFYRCFPDGVETKDLQCTGDPDDIMEGRKSFPSGHSSLSFCSLGVAAAWLCGRLGVLSRRGGSGGSGWRVATAGAPLLLAAAVAMSRSCDYHHHWQDIVVGSILGYGLAIFCYRQYYNPLSSDLSGVPYIVSSVNFAKYVNGKQDSPERSTSDSRDSGMESTPLLNGRKEDKWI